MLDESVIDPELREAARAAADFPKLFAPNFEGDHTGFTEGPTDEDLVYAENLKLENETLVRADGTSLRIMIALPKDGVSEGENLPVMLWLHSGGYVAFYPEHDMIYFNRLMRASRCIVVSPDYRLAPEHPYPAALEDAYAALLWTRGHIQDFGGDPSNVMLGGASAGGGLSTGLALYAHDKGELPIRFLMVICPMLDDRMITGSSQGNEAPIWNSALNEQGWKAMLGKLYGTDDVPAYAAPARAEDLSGMPPTCLCAGTLEPFRDEIAIFASRLVQAGVPVDLKIKKAGFHSFDMIEPNAAISQDAEQFMMKSFAFAVKHYTSPCRTAA